MCASPSSLNTQVLSFSTTSFWKIFHHLHIRSGRCCIHLFRAQPHMDTIYPHSKPMVQNSSFWFGKHSLFTCPQLDFIIALNVLNVVWGSFTILSKVPQASVMSKIFTARLSSSSESHAMWLPSWPCWPTSSFPVLLENDSLDVTGKSSNFSYRYLTCLPLFEM